MKVEVKGSNPLKEGIMEEVFEMHDKYESLVKYARVKPEHILEHKRVEEFMSRTKEKYPKEVENICSESGDWYHGFNSGMLAAIRYVMTSNNIDKETANDWFPELDT